MTAALLRGTTKVDFVLPFDLYLILPSNLLFSDFPTKILYCLYMLHPAGSHLFYPIMVKYEANIQGYRKRWAGFETAIT